MKNFDDIKWERMPQWANFLVMDKNRSIYIYEKKPIININNKNRWTTCGSGRWDYYSYLECSRIIFFLKTFKTWKKVIYEKPVEYKI